METRFTHGPVLRVVGDYGRLQKTELEIGDGWRAEACRGGWLVEMPAVVRADGALGFPQFDVSALVGGSPLDVGWR